jgi:hypothetical protein
MSFRRFACAIAAALAGLAWSGPAAAQDAVAVGLKAWQDNGCFNCHGTFGEGGEGGHFPAGPSLRRTRMSKEDLRETIACGRPGTEMPANLEGAYVRVPCFGLPLGPPPPGTTAGVAMPAAQLDAMVEYLLARVVGKSPNITKAECAAYHGRPDHPDCDNYR